MKNYNTATGVLHALLFLVFQKQGHCLPKTSCQSKSSVAVRYFKLSIPWSREYQLDPLAIKFEDLTRSNWYFISATHYLMSALA